jgi:hypothetical protein
MWIKSDKYGALNWGQLSQATDNVALLPDLSGTVIEANAVLFDGAGMFVRPKGAKNSNDLASDFSWGAVNTCVSGGGGLAADCNGYPDNAVRYDTPTWAGFSMSTSYGEDDMWDIAVKYAADWNSVKFSMAAGYTQLTDEGCNTITGSGNGNSTTPAGCTNVAVVGGGGLPNQNYRKDADIFQIGASVMHVPSGLFAYGLYQNEQNNGTQYKSFNFKTGHVGNSAANETDVWYVKAGIKKAWMPAGATVIFGEWGQYQDMFTGLCGRPGATGPFSDGNAFCAANLPIGVVQSGPSKGQAITAGALVTGSEVERYGIGVVQEIDSAAMHLFARWQHLDLDLNAVSLGNFGVKDGTGLKTSFEGLDIFQVGGVIFF